MEDFRFRAIDEPILPSSTPAAHSSQLQPLPQPLPLQLPLPVESQNAVEKQRIKEEIMRDIIRRRVLEEEVMRELIIDQMHRMGGQGFTFNYPFSYQSLDHPTQLLIPATTSFNSPLPDPLKDETKHKESDIQKIIMLPKPERNHLGEKRTAETEPLPLSNKKVKKEWFCQVCKVTTPNEIIFKDHLQGKKHRAKEGKLDEEKGIKLEGVEKEATSSEQKRFKFWCEICNVGTHSIVVMETHKKGKKHRKALSVQTWDGNNSSTITQLIT